MAADTPESEQRGGGFPAQLVMRVLHGAANSDRDLEAACSFLEQQIEAGKFTPHDLASMVYLVALVLRMLEPRGDATLEQRIRDAWRAAELGDGAIETYDMLREAARIELEGLPDDPPWSS